MKNQNKYNLTQSTLFTDPYTYEVKRTVSFDVNVDILKEEIANGEFDEAFNSFSEDLRDYLLNEVPTNN